MDPTHRGPQGRDSGALARTVQLVAADYLVTVNPVDGSEIEICPPTSLPEPPKRRTAEAREARQRAAEPAPPAGEAALDLPLLERTEERKRLVALLAQGRSVRLVGRSGSGRTALLNAVAADCADLAPDGVLRLSGHRRTPTDLLHEMFAAVHDAPRHRLGRAELLEAVARIGAVVVLDDAEFGGSALEELLHATPECAFLISATPDAAPPLDQTGLVEVPLEGLSRTACMELLALAARRPLSEDETEWAADLWFESEGLPLRFLQAGALLRHRDRLRAPAATPADNADADRPDAASSDTASSDTASSDTVEPDSEPADAVPTALSKDTLPDEGRQERDDRPAGTALHALPADRVHVEDPAAPDTAPEDSAEEAAAASGRAGTGAAPTAAGETPDPSPSSALPPLSVSISPAQVAAALSPLALETLRLALALGGELPHQAHLPALVDDPRADTALAELAAAGLATASGACYRLSGGVAGQLVAARAAADQAGELPDFADERDTADRALRAARHYAWWAGHPSVTAERVATEAGAVLSAIQGAKKAGHPSTAALLAHTASPVFAASLLWSAWESALRGGQEAARLAGEVAEEAYFHHELGVLALCQGNVERARAELEASIGLRGALADKRGAVAGRRALALVEDRTAPAATPPEPHLPGAAVRPETPATGTRLATAVQGAVPPRGPVAEPSAGDGPAGRRRWPVVGTARRNMAAAGAGVLLAVVLGTVMTLGNTSGKDAPTSDVRPSTSTSSDEQPFPSNVVERDRTSQAPPPADPLRPVAPTESAPSPSPSGTDPDESERPTSEPGTPTAEPSEPTRRPTDPDEPTRTPSTPPTEPEKPTPTPTPTPTETDDPDPDPEPSASFTSSSPPTTPTASASATEDTLVAA
ncbi:ATP-binding protein [Streptomyces durbertensis]|uniref:ATP-binding protein n=1 Tax=Streptomyces durbertensis TaxID=2448886 RepID=A0ABR6EBD3_9ACTN|nr:ATP-binding protein [Streptomyces durbertensis]MBB1242636.1 ATP-binding protein [Streptomyces durbertensis]